MNMILSIIKTKCKENSINFYISQQDNIYNIDFENNNKKVKSCVTEIGSNNFQLGIYSRDKKLNKDKCKFYKNYNSKMLLDLYKYFIGWFIVDNEFYGGK